MKLQGKTILVTGTSSGIGLATVNTCLELGARVYANVLNAELADVAQKQFRGDATILTYDVADWPSVEEAFERIKQEANGLDGLVNNAGVLVEKPFLETSLHDFQRVMDVNVKAAFYHSQKACDIMLKQQRGSIVNLSSYVGSNGTPLFSAYASTKGALISFTKSLAKEFGAEGIRVNAVAPGFIESNMTQHYVDEVREALMTQVSMQRSGEAEEVANAIAYLLSDEASYVSGHVLSVDGAAFF